MEAQTWVGPPLPADIDREKIRGIEERYANERAIVQAVASGNEELAVQLIPRGMQLNRNPDVLRDTRNTLIILNTILRKALELVHLHPYHIDAVSSRWGIRIEQAPANEPSDLRDLVIEMVRDYARAARSYTLGGYSPNVRAAIEYIFEHLGDEDLSAGAAARELKLSPSYLSHQFNQELSMGIPEFIKRLRLDRAQLLLRIDDGRSVSAIAYEVGFSDPGYFSKCFRATVGCSPTEYRNRYRSGEPDAAD